MIRWLLHFFLRPVSTCQCGRALDDLGECQACDWEAPESGPRTKRSEELKKVVGH